MALDLTTETVSPIKFSAAVRFFGNNLDFELISKSLDARPSDQHKAGERGLSRKPFSKDLWSLDSPLPGHESLEAHLGWLRRKLEPHYSFLQTLKQKGGSSQFLRSYRRQCGMQLSTVSRSVATFH